MTDVISTIDLIMGALNDIGDLCMDIYSETLMQNVLSSLDDFRDHLKKAMDHDDYELTLKVIKACKNLVLNDGMEGYDVDA